MSDQEGEKEKVGLCIDLSAIKKRRKRGRNEGRKRQESQAKRPMAAAQRAPIAATIMMVTPMAATTIATIISFFWGRWQECQHRD